jgi:hypothetical protein
MPGAQYDHSLVEYKMAANDLLGTFFPSSNEPPAAHFAFFGVKSSWPALRFLDAATGQAAIFTSSMPPFYGGNGVILRLFFSATQNTGDVDWGIEFARVVPGTTNPASISWSSQTIGADVAVPGTVGVIKTVDVSVADGAALASVVAGDVYRLRLQRRSADDALAGEAELFAIQMFEAPEA